MNDISFVVIPIFILLVVFYGYFHKINVYDSFLLGAKDGLKIVYNIFPAILAMVFAVNLFLDSNVLNFLLNPLSKILSLPAEILPLAVLRPISGTASMTIMTNIFELYGPDSFAGRLASVLQGCTDTTIYVIALYYSSIKVSKIRYTLFVGLLADLVGIIMAFILTNIFF
ncbi:MAG: spore maturation protein [Firmicutes bacterium]|nr:spore maturation protein [Bacillota bacterium]